MTEPARATIMRNGTIALCMGAILALATRRPSIFPQMAAVALWPSFGGHFVEIFFLNHLAPRMPDSDLPLRSARLALWFVAGIAIAYCMQWTSVLLGGPGRIRPAWWLAGLLFIGLELIANALLWSSGRPNFFTACKSRRSS